MTRRPVVDVKASVAARLRNVAARQQVSLDMIARRYAIERLLYRLSRSPWRDRFLLKGAMLFAVWLPDPLRPTQDLDLLSVAGDADPTVPEIVAALCAQPVPEDDGLVFAADTLVATPIRGAGEQGGVRVRLTARLARSRIPVQIDVGFGDAVTPRPRKVTFPTLLDGPAPRLKAYPMETVVAEKLAAVVALGAANSRLKDYYDLMALARLFEFDGRTLARAIAATFAARSIGLPAARPPGLSAEFATAPAQLAQWSAFLQREALLVEAGTLAEGV